MPVRATTKKRPEEPKQKPKVNHKAKFEKSGLCPQCGNNHFLTMIGLPAKCEWCCWLVPKGWKIK